MPRTIPLACTIVLLAACGEREETALPREDTGLPQLQVADEHNLRWMAKLDCPNPGAQPETDVVIRWGGLDQDILGRPIDPVGRAHVYQFERLGTDVVLQRLLSDSLSQSDVSAYGYCVPAGTECRLDEFNLPGHPLYLPQSFTVGSGTWMVMLTSALDSRLMSLLLLKAEEGSGLGQVSFDTEACDLDHHAALGEALAIPMDGSTTIDWSGLSRDGLGRPIEPDDLDTVRLLRLELSPREAMGGLFLLPELASDRWEQRATGKVELDLRELLAGDTGEATSLDPTSLWLLGFWDTGASFDAPRALLRLEPH
jgi:hypothetical protein